MARKKDVEISTTINIVVDYPVYEEFKKLVGSQNASREIRAMIKERVLTLKNEKPQSDQEQGLKRSNKNHISSSNDNRREIGVYNNA